MRGWPLVALGDIFEIARGGSPRPIQNYITEDPDGVNWISISDASDSSKHIKTTKKRIIKAGVKNSRMVHPGDFLLTNSMSFGRPYIMQTSGCIHDGWLVLSMKKNNVNQDYFFHLLGSNAVYAEFSRLAAGATVKNLNIDLVKGVQIPLPPLPTQLRIAAVLDKAEELRAKRRTALALLDSLSQAIFLEMFGDPVANPEGWPLKCLKDLGRVKTGGTPPSSKPGMFDGFIPFITPGDLENYETVKRTVTEEGAAEAETVRPGAALVCCIGATIGKMSKSTQYTAFNQQINAVEWSHDVDDDFGVGVLRFFKKQIAAWGASTTLPILKKSSFEKIEIPIPPLNLQQEFARRIATVEKLKTAHRAALKELDALFASLQHRAFRGEL